MYWITSPNGPIPVYCDMDGSNCDSHGGWMRVVKVDLNVSNDCIGSAFEVFVANGKKVFEEYSFKAVVYQHTLIQKVRITLGYVVKYEDTNTEQQTALVVLMQLIYHLMPTMWMVYPLHTELILANTYSRMPRVAQRVDPVGHLQNVLVKRVLPLCSQSS